MRKLLSLNRVVLCSLVAAACVLGGPAKRSEARQVYYALWQTTYPDVAKENDVKATVKCNVCHTGVKKENRNAYGKAIQKALGTHKNLKKKDKDAILQAFKKAEAEKSETPDKTFGDLLKDNQLPAKGK